jgi:hypothetical protein
MIITIVDSSLYRIMFRVDVKVEGFMSVDANGRKRFTRGFTRDWVMDSDSMTLDLLNSTLKSETSWGENQKVIFWVHDKRAGEDHLIDSDNQLKEVIDMYKEERNFILYVSVFDKEVCEPIEVVLLINQSHAQSASNEAGPSAAAHAESDDELPNMDDVFDAAEEYVGVDDEYIYGIKPQSTNGAATGTTHNESATATTNNATATTHNEPSDEAANQPPTEPYVGAARAASGNVVEPVMNDDDPQFLVVTHDPELPDITKDALFPDMITFRKAIRNHAVQSGFELAPGVKTDKTRFIARCAAKGYPWRIRASRLQDEITVQVMV